MIFDALIKSTSKDITENKTTYSEETMSLASTNIIPKSRFR